MATIARKFGGGAEHRLDFRGGIAEGGGGGVVAERVELRG